MDPPRRRLLTDPSLQSTTLRLSDSAAGPTGSLPVTGASDSSTGSDETALDIFANGLIGALPIHVRQLLQAGMRRHRFRCGDVVIRQGTEGRSLFLIERGSLRVSTDDDTGQSVELATLGRGEVVGEMALLCQHSHTADVIAETDADVFEMPADEFEALCRQEPEVAQVLTNLIADRLGVQSHDALCQESLGGFRIRQRLGRGGMAVVYDAEQEHTGRRVALKMMSHRLIYDQEALRLFQREGDLIARFRHPHIPRLYDRFEAFRTFFLVLEYVNGQSLKQLLPEQGLPGDVVLKLLGQIADALSYAHEAGVVHRDIKPSNIMLQRDGRVCLMDFGLAFPLAERTGEDSPRLTGTPRYMAPEQLLGGAVGPPADYFGLGCMAYELLTGRPLIGVKTISGILKQHAHWSVNRFADVLPNSPMELRRLLDRSLSASPEDRFVDLGELKAAAAPVDWSAMAS